MKLIKTYTIAAVPAAGLATSAALAQGDTPVVPDGTTGGMMQDNGMMPGGDMPGMMQQKAHHLPGHHDGATPPAGHDATPAPQGG